MDDGDKKKIIIVGGGLAGISAALAALERGWIPLVFEKNDSLGGRVRSFRLNGIGTFDNGQHVLSGCYTHTKWLLNQINSTPLVKFQKRLEIFFLLSAGRSVHFRTWNLPAPFHLLMPLWLKMPLTSEDRSFLLRWGRDFYRLSETQLKSCSVQEWLKMYGRTNLLTPILWSPLALATMNTPLEQASALLFYRILKLAFLAGVQESGLGIPQAFLNELFVAPAYSKILENGGKIFTRHRITKLRVEDGRINMLITASGKSYEADAFILALPPKEVYRIINTSINPLPSWVDSLLRFQYSPIITINFWTSKPIPHPIPIALVNSPIHWIFSLPENRQEPHGYTAVISGAFSEVSQPASELIHLLEREIHRFLGKQLDPDFQLIKAKVVKEKFATILQTPASLNYRPQSKTPLTNLFLAGDWINTELPATIESAVKSGREAVDQLTIS